MPQELMSKCPEIPAPLIDSKKAGKVRGLISKNQITITTILVLTPSITIPAYYDWNNPLIGSFLGFLTHTGMMLCCFEHMTKEGHDITLKDQTSEE